MRHSLPQPTAGSYAALIFGLVLTWMLHGTLPGIASPTLGQAIWTSGFALSFADSFPPGLVATHFGAPEPAAIAFGLAGAYPVALLICAGLHPADAYSAMVAIWLAVAFLSAWRISLRLGAGPYLAVAAAFIWTSLPLIWVHASYSMSAIGFALLPFYFLAVLRLIAARDQAAPGRAGTAAFYLLACLTSVFMDGYSFMMFAVGSSLLLLGAFLNIRDRWKYFVFFAAPVHAIAFAAAYLLYALYIGKTQFDAAPITFFRGWGADLTFFLWPTKGVLWIGDLLNISQERTQRQFFGDHSVWVSTFILPFALVGLAAWIFTHRQRGWLATAFLLLALCGLYLSLGPSLKIDSTRPAELLDAGELMPASAALGSTGTAWLSKHVPGFRNMRASYRWIALAYFGFWLLLVLLLGRLAAQGRRLTAGLICALLVVSNLPPLTKTWRANAENRDDFMAIDRELVADLRQELVPGERIAFLPYRNDFFANYLAPASDTNAYNIGGDKNLMEARENWPEIMRQFPMSRYDDAFGARILLMLARHEADVVVLPYIDLLVAAHVWPSPNKYREDVAATLKELSATGLVSIDERTYYATVRLAPELRPTDRKEALERRIRRTFCLPPECVAEDEFDAGTLHLVGEIRDRALRATGQAGYLHFGPYAPIGPGTYRLTLFGTATAPAGAWADVASSEGAQIHGHFPIPDHSGTEGLILDQTMKLDRAVPDAEIRLWVEPQSDLRFTGYRLQRID